ncbi:MAG: NTP transferase domain-containing protein [Bacteroidales bacterium]|nr:NTP transferase domain-containing protein [Bacteroidales bacterium]
MKTTLLILAAGMGSRYGGLKQLDKLGPHGETIMDYSVRDAIAAGFSEIVFVIRRNMEADFKEAIMAKYQKLVKVNYVFQELDTLPAPFKANPERTKPYGTAHAILSAKNAITTPFAVINADDFYGADAFATLSKFFGQLSPTDTDKFAMVGYQLPKTLSENGSVSRGVCSVDNEHNLVSITEMTKIERINGVICNKNEDGSYTNLPDNTIVSMNFWGFTPKFFDQLENLFCQFLEKNNDNPKSEFQIPTVVNHFLTTGSASIKVLVSSAEWFGVTYKEDRPIVVERLKHIK